MASGDYANDPDPLDSLVAALTARRAWQGRTLLPNPTQKDAAKREGWIHFSCDLPAP